MKVTKYGHACFTVEKDGQFLVVDPGNMSPEFISPENVVAIVVTHAHADHFDHDLIASIVDKNPDAIIVGPEEVTSKIEVFETKAVTGGDSLSVGEFDLKFYGHEHAVVHASRPIAQNVGVFINDLLYFPGDSFTIPDTQVTVLALPVSGPWLKLGEVVDFLHDIAPRRAFPVHESIHSDRGNTMTNDMLAGVAQQTQTEYTVLQPGESMTI